MWWLTAGVRPTTTQQRTGEVPAYFPDAVSAYKAGLARHPDRRFSMQEVRAKPLEFGWFSHVVPGIDANSSAD